jgi:hypothetical protein
MVELGKLLAQRIIADQDRKQLEHGGSTNNLTGCSANLGGLSNDTWI